jgi:hypothetical protein
MRGYWKLKEEALNRPVYGTRFGKGNGPITRKYAFIHVMFTIFHTTYASKTDVGK